MDRHDLVHTLEAALIPYWLLKICNRVSRSEFLPNLARIEVAFLGAGNAEILEVLLFPSLKSLTIHGTLGEESDGENHAIIVSLIEQLPNSCPNLTDLRLPFQEHCAAAMASCLKRLPSLHTVHLPRVGRDAALFDAFKTLEILDLEIGEGTLSQPNKEEVQRKHDVRWLLAKATPTVLHPGDFSRLRVLSMDTTVEFATSFLKSCTPSLTSFEIKCIWSNIEQVQDLLGQLTTLAKPGGE
ncbi:hypothetical protein DACRYDRAFT_109255 [Dacryopinax primogenitus]|uniref:F-box domain-containing protein n=1 Tax=Dacryopinax primogenitus (strain DJM 731) TaxID=1858805 RepID=M5G1R9_DACPD|nr:uncharacterized protein DACRYDRAFT_109255 [Dacryopinax primogenitus]EJT99831.1 hypothetical protein DACRYDRAFT_109255 [Dacryopinax primogenitus]